MQHRDHNLPNHIKADVDAYIAPSLTLMTMVMTPCKQSLQIKTMRSTISQNALIICVSIDTSCLQIYQLFQVKTTENVLEWIYVVNKNMEANEIPVERRVNLIINCVKELALSTYRRLTEDNPNITWIDLCATFINTFMPPDYQLQLRDQLRHHKQIGNFQQYLLKFQTLVNQILDMSEQDKISHFIGGLPDDTRFNVITRNPNDLETAIIIASQYDACRKQSVPLNIIQNFPKPPLRKQFVSTGYSKPNRYNNNNRFSLQKSQ